MYRRATRSGKSPLVRRENARSRCSRRCRMIGTEPSLLFPRKPNTDVDLRCPSRPQHERPGLEPRYHPAGGRDPGARSGADRQEGSGQRDGLAGRDAARPDRALRRDADRPLHRTRQHAARLAQPRDRLGADPGAACLVPRDGGGAADGGDRRSSEPRSPCRALDERSAGQCPDRLHPEPGRGGFDPDPAPSRARLCAGVTRRRAGPLRARPLCAGHACQRRPRSARSRAARGDAPAEHHSRRHAPVR